MRRKSRILLLFVICSISNAIQVKNGKNSRLYQGPKNPRRSHLSSYILRAHSTIPPKYFTGSPKPVWDEPVKPFKPIKTYSVECYPGQSCSQTIPLWAVNQENSQEYQPNTYEYHHDTNSILDRNDKINEIEIQDKVTFKPKVITTSTAEPTTLGLSVASVYHPAIPHWQIPTTKLPISMPSPTEAESIEEPVYNNYQRYDPFMFHSQISKRSFLKKPTVQQRKPSVQHLKPIISNYKVPRPVQVARREPIVTNLRNTLTWKNNRKPTEHNRNQYEEPSGYHHHRNHYSVNRRVGHNGYNDHEEYFPGQQRLSNSKPKRNYFPVPDHQDDGTRTQQDTPYHHHSDYDEHTDFVGEAQVVNAGYTVDESIDPHGYLMSSYENIKKPEKEFDLSHYYDVKPTKPSKPWKWTTTVEPWTSLDEAKPDWGEVIPSSSSGQDPDRESTLTYGSWNKDTLKLSAVPFSRSTDGRERQWVKISSVKRKRKRIPGGTRHLVLDENLGLNVNQ